MISLLKKCLGIVGLISALCTGVASHAQTASAVSGDKPLQTIGGVGVTSEVGTTGFGAHMVIPLQPAWQMRFGFGHLGYGYSGRTGSVAYDLSLKARTYDALLDWYPQPGKSFRITAGVAYNGNKIDARARPDGNGVYTLQGRQYQAEQVGRVMGNVEFNKLAPYLGVGWSTGNREKGWSVSSDVGVLFQGKPRTSLGSSGCNAGAAVCSQFAADVRRESAALNDEASKFRLYPVLRVGVNYRF